MSRVGRSSSKYVIPTPIENCTNEDSYGAGLHISRDEEKIEKSEVCHVELGFPVAAGP